MKTKRRYYLASCNDYQTCRVSGHVDDIQILITTNLMSYIYFGIKYTSQSVN